MKYKRVLLKFSGEALAGDKKSGISFDEVLNFAREIKECADLGVEIAIVVGGGNFWRGKANPYMDRATSDYIGMLATTMNALALGDAFKQIGAEVRVQTGIEMRQVAEFYKNAEQYKSNGLITEEPTTEVIPQTKYSPGLLALFKNHAELIDELARESDDEIARQIKKWAKEKDETGRALIENPENGLRLKYAQLLKEAGIIKLSVESFRKKL